MIAAQNAPDWETKLMLPDAGMEVAERLYQWEDGC
jgi:hypothetical protein